MPYQPFLISDLRIGLELDIEPWLLPKDAFSTLDNCYLKDGILQKRLGYTEFGDTLGAVDVVGIHEFVETDGSRALIVNTINRSYEWNAAGSSFTDLDGSDVWTGTAANLVSATNFRGNLYMANAKDQVRSFDGTNTATVVIDIDGDTTNNLDFCVHIFVQKERLLLFNTSEDGIRHPQRVRWPRPGTVDYTNDEFIDAPTQGWLIAVAPVKDDFVCWFEDGVWLLRYTGNATLPFRWERISKVTNAAASFSAIEFEESAMALGKTGMNLTDAVDVQSIDKKIPNFTLNMSQNSIGTAYGLRFDELDQAWMFYPDVNSTANDRCLVLNTKDFNWATLSSMPFLCAGLYETDDPVTWATITGTWADQTDPWVSNQVQAGFPVVLAGKSNGKVYRLNNGSSDDSASISMEALSGRWNPYRKSGKKSRLGYIDFLVTTENNTSISVDFYLDFNDVAYKTETLSFDGDGDKEWIRIFCGAVGESHRIRMYQNKTGQVPKIHAIMPWFKPAGRLT